MKYFFFLSIILLHSCILSCSAQKATKGKIIKRGGCCDNIFYEVDGVRLYLNPEYDSLFSQILINGDLNFNLVIKDICLKGDCLIEDEEVRQYISRSNCNFNGNFTTIEFVEKKEVRGSNLNVEIYHIGFICCGMSVKRNPVYTLIIKKENTGKQKVLKFEYSYDEL